MAMRRQRRATGATCAAGLILLILALFEKPKGILSLTLGTVLYLGAAAAGVLGFVWGTQ